MAEKILHEVRFVETDDGFRIEIKGDKERLRELGLGCGPGMGFGPGRRFARRSRRHGPWGHMRGFGPWAWGWWDEEAEEAGDEAESEAKA